MEIIIIIIIIIITTIIIVITSTNMQFIENFCVRISETVNRFPVQTE